MCDASLLVRTTPHVAFSGHALPLSRVREGGEGCAAPSPYSFCLPFVKGGGHWGAAGVAATLPTRRLRDGQPFATLINDSPSPPPSPPTPPPPLYGAGVFVFLSPVHVPYDHHKG